MKKPAVDIDVGAFRTIFEQSPISTQIFLPTGTTVSVNKAWEKLWGLTLADLEGYNILQDTQLRTQGVLEVLQRACAGETVEMNEFITNLRKQYFPIMDFPIAGLIL